MRLRSKTTSLLVSILLVTLLLSFIPQAALQEIEQTGTEIEIMDTVVAGTPHGPIDISGDDQFKSIAEGESWPGNGSESDPYIIEDFDIDLGGTNGRCIYIRHTTAHFIIRNCTFTGASIFPGTGVNLLNVTSFEISENIFFDNQFGMSITGDSATIVNNEVLSTVNVGFYLNGLENSSISHNTIHGGQTGLLLEGLQHCEINNNSITGSNSAGIYLEFTDNCTFNRNTCSECGNGIYFSFSDDNSFKDCILERNTNGLFFDG
ncbi:MAG: right-handed parallel beta-helix repeat-containing protein, partial [Candidatus Thorarchaeota archaeon]